MDFVPFDYTDRQRRSDRIALWSVVIMSLGLIALGIWSIHSFRETLGGALGALPFLTGFMLPLFVWVGSIERTKEKLKLRDQNIRNELGSHYGLTLSEGEFQALDYPIWNPTSSFGLFGSIRRSKQLSGASFVEHTVYLVWADGQMQLSESEDGKNFSELRSSLLTE